MRRVVVTGLGCVSPLGNTAAEALEALRTGRSGLVSNPEMAELGFRCWVYGAVRDFDASRLDKRALQTLSPSGQYALAAALEAIADAGIDPSVLASNRSGVILGTMVGGINDATRVERMVAEQRRPSRVGTAVVAKIMNSTAAGNIAAYLGARGRAYSVSSACSTGSDSIGHAYELVAFGVQDICLAGSSEEDCWKQIGPAFENWGGTPGSFNDRPEAACRPYDVDREGVVMAAGAGVLLLEPLEAAVARGAHIYAEIVGYGCANDGEDMFHPTGKGAAHATRQALARAATAGVDRIDYINTHGTATRLGDEVEIAWLKEVFGGDVPPLSSTKGQTGHAQGATGALEAVFTLLMLEHGFIAPTVNLEHVDPACDGVPHVREVTSAPLRTALTVNAGLGGTNSCLVFQRL